MAHLLISAAHKSSGKTTISIGLCAALARRGLAVQPYKKGPDYIDPLWLGQASGRPCHNLDFHTQSLDEIRYSVATHSADADISIIEGNKGLHDGVNIDGSNSNAALAKLLDSPVVLVIDTRGMTRGVAALVQGFQAFDPDVAIRGVILNQVGGSRHEGKLREIIERYTDLPVLGAVGRDENLHIDERHLGLVPSNEQQQAGDIIDAFAQRIAAEVDLEAISGIAQQAPPLMRPSVSPPAPAANTELRGLRVGIIQDDAFGFYYPGDLQAFSQRGVELVKIDSMRDETLPAIDGLFIGGGFPETHAEKISANTSLRNAIAVAVEQDLPVYAECGGLMYLTRSLRWGDSEYPMVGALPADTVMYARPQGRGYVVLEEDKAFPWPALNRSSAAQPVPAHEFHYSALENLAPDLRFAWHMKRGKGIADERDGIVYRNVLGNYSHLRHTWTNPWVWRFLNFVAAVREETSRRATNL